MNVENGIDMALVLLGMPFQIILEIRKIQA